VASEAGSAGGAMFGVVTVSASALGPALAAADADADPDAALGGVTVSASGLGPGIAAAGAEAAAAAAAAVAGDDAVSEHSAAASAIDIVPVQCDGGSGGVGGGGGGGGSGGGLSPSIQPLKFGLPTLNLASAPSPSPGGEPIRSDSPNMTAHGTQARAEGVIKPRAGAHTPQLFSSI